MDLHAEKETFQCPPIENRPAPFWFWNDHLNPDRLVSQYDRLLEAGMGGAVLHARSGLEAAEYLDERWFAAIQAVVEHAQSKGTIVWLYDELGWPSGSAGGRVLRKNPELGIVHLVMHDLTPKPGDDFSRQPGELIGAYHVTKSDPNHGVQRRTDRGDLLPHNVTLLPDRIRYEEIKQPVKASEWVGKRLLLFWQVMHGGIIDYLNPRATEAFLQSTHEEYYRRFGEYFGTTITHSFMDEAGTLSGESSLPWTPGLEKEFEKRRGYSLIPHLPALFFEVPGHEAIRFDYWTLVTELFREGFGIPMHTWCSDHRIAYSGHYVFETTLKEATRQLGSTMPLYEYQGMPGIDVLGGDMYSYRFDHEAYAYYLVMIKQASSVSDQLNKGGLMSESYGVAGHAMGPEAMQVATNFQMALGVTMINQHAAFYSMRGKRKLDHPPIIGWQQPYWPFIKKHMDTVARTSWLLSRGTRSCDVLILHPAASMHAVYRQFRVRDEYKAENYLFDADMPFELIDKHFSLLSVALLDAQIDFEYGDEEIMARHAVAENGLMRVGKMSYRLVVLPLLVNMRSSTLALLRSFAGQGGRIFLVGSAPHLLDGRPSNEAAEFLSEHATRVVEGVEFFDYRQVIAELTAHGGRTVTLKTAEGEDVPAMKVHSRLWDGREIVYLANVSREPVSAHLSFTPGVTGRLEEWDTTTGKTSPTANCYAGKELRLALNWAAKQARAFVAVPGHAEIPAPAVFAERKRIRSAWTGTRTGPNVLLLDECLICDDGRTQTRYSIAQARSLLAKRMGSERKATTLTTFFPLTISEDNPPSGTCELAVEFGKRPRVSLNGKAVSLRILGWVMDPANQKIALPALQPGENVLQVEGTYEQATDLESPWLLGDFNVFTSDRVAFAVARANDPVPIGSWPKVGLPFYAGTVVYRAEVDLDDLAAGDRVVLDMPGLAGSAQVSVNGGVVDHVLWPPYECDLTSSVKPGRNIVEVEVANTLRNLLGAHFNPREEARSGAPISSYGGVAGQPKAFLDYGLLDAPEIVISRRR